MATTELLRTAAGLLPFVFLVSVAWFRICRGTEVSRAAVDAFTVWVAVSYLSAELFSFFDLIAFLPVLSLWVFLIGLVLIGVVRTGGRLHPLHSNPKSIAFLIVAFFTTVTLFIALTAEPNNWDSQTYHLPRIEHWIQNGSLAFYLTPIDRQNDYPPIAEILILHARLLSGGDNFSLLVQWSAMLCSNFAVFRITRQLGGEESQSWIAAVFVSTLPMGILQSTSTQNDYVTAALVACFVTSGLDMVKATNPLNTSLVPILAGALSGMVKPVGYLVGAPFALWFFIELARHSTLSSMIKFAAASGVILTLVIAPFAARNLFWYESIRSESGALTLNASLGVRQVLDNLILNTTSNLVTGNKDVDDYTTAAVLRVTSYLGLDAHRADTMFFSMPFRMPDRLFRLHEDYGPNPLHTILILMMSVSIFFKRWRPRFPTNNVLTYWFCWFGGVILFALILRWQPWAVRLQLPSFVLTAPLIAVTWPSSWRLESLKTVSLIAVLAFLALPALLLNASRQLMPTADRPSYLSQNRVQRLFINKGPDYAAAYVAAVRSIVQSHSSQIGLVSGVDDWEYPLWRLLRDGGHKLSTRIEHVLVEPGYLDDTAAKILQSGSKTRRWPLGPFVPDALMWTAANPPERVSIEGREFERLGGGNKVVAFVRKNAPSEGGQ